MGAIPNNREELESLCHSNSASNSPQTPSTRNKTPRATSRYSSIKSHHASSNTSRHKHNSLSSPIHTPSIRRSEAQSLPSMKIQLHDSSSNYLRLKTSSISTNSIYRFQNRFDSSTSSRHSINSPLSTKHLPLPTPPTTTKTTPARFPISAQNSPIANFLQKLTH